MFFPGEVCFWQKWNNLRIKRRHYDQRIWENGTEKAKGKLDHVSLSVAINKQYTSNNAEIKDGDEVAFIPPVQGG